MLHIEDVCVRLSLLSLCVAALDCSYQFNFISPLPPCLSKQHPPHHHQSVKPVVSLSVCVMDCWESNEVPPSPLAFLWQECVWRRGGGQGARGDRLVMYFVHLPFSSPLPPSCRFFLASHLPFPSISPFITSSPTLPIPSTFISSIPSLPRLPPHPHTACPPPPFPPPLSAVVLPFICRWDCGLMGHSRPSTKETHTECCY